MIASRSYRRPHSSKFLLLLGFLSLMVSAPAFGQTGAQTLFQQVGNPLVGTGVTGVNPQQGFAVAVSADGTTAAVGAPSGKGAVLIYTNSGGVWSQQGGPLLGTGPEIPPTSLGPSAQGHSVALSADGNTLVEGATNVNANGGAVWVFVRSAGVWSQQGPGLVGSGTVGTGLQGSSVSVSADGNTLVEGGIGDNQIGAVWVFSRSGGVWTQQGAKLVGTGSSGTGNPQQGSSISLSADGNTLIEGGEFDNNSIGGAWIFTRVAGVWTQQGTELVGTGFTGTPQQGNSVAISGDGNTALVGGLTDNGEIGGMWVFTRNAGVWTQQGGELVGAGGTGASQQGGSVSLSADGNTAIEGGSQDNTGIGAVWTFTRTGGIWSQLGTPLLATGGTEPSELGSSVALSRDGTTAVLGAIGDNNSVGAAWIFGTSTKFGGLNVTGGSTQTIAVQFSSAFTVGAINVVTQGVRNLDFMIPKGLTPPGGCSPGVSYNAGDSCIVNVQFTPTAPGLRAGAILFYDDDCPPNLVATVYISGIGLAPQVGFVNGLINTVAGTGAFGYTGDGGPAVSAAISDPYGMGIDSLNNLYIYQGVNPAIRAVNASTALISTVAGNGTNNYSGDGGPATSATISDGDSVAVDGAGNLYIDDRQNRVIRRVQVGTGTITTFAGNGTNGSSGDGGPAINAQFSDLVGIVVDGSGNLYATDSQSQNVRKVNINTGIISTIAGITGSAGYSGDGGPATSAQINGPLAAALDAAGNLYFCDDTNNVIRRVDALTGIVTTVAGLFPGGGYTGDGGPAISAQLNDPEGLTIDSAGNLYIADSSNNVMRKVSASTGIITTIAGNPTTGYAGDGGSAAAALINYPVTPVIDSLGNLFIVDAGNDVVREVSAVAPLSFGTASINSSSAAQDVTVTNDGSAPMTFSSITPSTDFNLTGPDTTCTTGMMLNPGDSCVLGIEFSPTVGGPLSEVITLVSNAGTQTVPVGGSGALNASVTALVSSMTPAAAGNSVTFTATITSPGSGIPTGMVTFFDGATSIGTGTLNGSAVGTFATSSLTLGTHMITAVYGGDTSFTGSTSPVFTETISAFNPVPTLTSLSQTTAIAGSSSFTLTLTGTNFESDTVVDWNGVALITTFVSPTQVTAVVPVSDVSSGGTDSVTAFNPTPGGGTTSAITFTVSNPAPTLTQISPAVVTTGAAAFTLTLTGTNFVPTSVANFNGQARVTTFVSATSLTAAILASDVVAAGAFPVTVTNSAPGGGTSAAVTMNVNNPVPALTSLSPSSASANSGAFTLTVNGTNFVSGSVVNWNGSPRVTTFVSATQLTAAILASDIPVSTFANVTVMYPAPGGGVSGGLSFLITTPVPAITLLAPSSAFAGDPAFTLTVTGSNFLNTSVVQWNGTARTTTFVSATSLTAAITAADILTVGSAAVNVSTPMVPLGGAPLVRPQIPSGTLSNTLTFTISPTNPLPTLTSLSPATVSANSGAFILTVNGTGFVTGSVVNWNGSPRATTFVSATQLTAAILASDIPVSTSASVTVFSPTPGGGTSNALQFSISTPIPAITLLTPSSAFAGAPAFTLTVTGSNFLNTSVVQWNGTARTTTFVSATSLTAAITAADILTAGPAAVNVLTPPVMVPGPSGIRPQSISGALSNTLTFTISPANPIPTLTSLSPTSVSANSGAFTLTVNGAGFVNGSVVNWGGSPRVTTFVSATQLTAAILASDIPVSTFVGITVFNPTPGGGTSAQLSFLVSTPVPAITSLNPSSAFAGGAAFTLTVTGSNFLNTSLVQWNGTSRTTTFVSATSLTAVITAADIAAVGTATVNVFTPTVGLDGAPRIRTQGASGTTSNSLTFTISPANPLPTLTSLLPTTAQSGGAAFTLTLNGTSFIPTSVANWKGSARVTTFVSATQLTAAITAADLATSGAAAVTVFNPTPGGGTSNAVTFTVTDFSVTSPNPIQTVTAGQSANFTIITAPVGGTFTGNVTFTTSALPAGVAASFNPTSVPSGSSTTMTLTTTARSSLPPSRNPFNPISPIRPIWLFAFLLTAALASLTLTKLARPSVRRRLIPIGAFAVLLISAGYLSGCAGSGFPKTGTSGTPAGSFPITVTGTSGTDVHSTIVTLNVQ
jgi:hypothetical protein